MLEIATKSVVSYMLVLTILDLYRSLGNAQSEYAGDMQILISDNIRIGCFPGVFMGLYALGVSLSVTQSQCNANKRMAHRRKYADLKNPRRDFPRHVDFSR